MRALLRLVVLIVLACIIISFAFAFGFGVNYYSSHIATAQVSNGTIPSLNIFWEAWGIIQNDFYGTVPDKPALTHGAIRGMLRALHDSHTVLVEPEPAKNEQSNLQGETGDVGLNLDVRNQTLIVVSALPNSPADKGGIKTGDVILKINNKDVSPDVTVQQASGQMRGAIGSKILLTIHHVGEPKPIDVELARERYNLPTVESKMLPNTKFGYIKVSLETSETANEFGRALDSLKSQSATGLVIDLRNNPGGLFPDPVLEISGQFLKNNDVVVYEKYRDGTEKPYNAGNRRGAVDLPLVILVNNGTASAAEILAGALRDYKRAVLIGEPTYGKGSVQSIRQLSDGAALHITIATWYTPKHSEIEGKGLVPDFSIPLTDDDVKKGTDPQLNRAIDYLTKGA
jgi:carboxyl-terminal processing protease